MAEAFMGYLLPWGQMSYWGAQVIISLFGAIPYFGESLALWIRGDYVIGMEMPESNSINIDEHFDFISASAALEYEEFNKDLEFFVKFTNSKQKK